ncbi:MAG: hypothetical protein V4474_01020 [Patescibacteria group bacterium]
MADKHGAVTKKTAAEQRRTQHAKDQVRKLPPHASVVSARRCGSPSLGHIPLRPFSGLDKK